jgi:hypothetical protein
MKAQIASLTAELAARSREEKIMKSLIELFGGDWIVLRDGKRLGMKDLATQTTPMGELKNLDNRLCHPLGDPERKR